MWYLVRRHLGFEIDEWESLDWIKQRVYLQGLREEFYDEDSSVDSDDSDDWDTGLPPGVEVKRIVTDG